MDRHKQGSRSINRFFLGFLITQFVYPLHWIGLPWLGVLVFLIGLVIILWVDDAILELGDADESQA